MRSFDFLVIGGGIIGVSIARELRRRHPDLSVALLEKEKGVGEHGSGRNSGVLHAGFYYSADSLKARFTAEGNARLAAYCRERKLALNPCGKLVVAQNEAEHAALDELLVRGKRNGVLLHNVTEEEARAIEPRARTCGRALFSPNTSTVDPRQVMDTLAADARDEGVTLLLDTPYVARTPEGVRTPSETLAAGYVVNAAGLYADRIARDYGFSQRFRILPFRGLYLLSDEPLHSMRAHVYPVPDLRNPFLGTHFTVRVDGRTKIGPTAMPAFWREQYGGFSRFRIGELFEILRRQVGLVFGADFDFFSLAASEFRKVRRAYLVRLARRLAEGVETRAYRTWGKPGIRAQLLDIQTRRLVMDFVFEGDRRSFHVLNAVSPGFTCALPFADHVCDEIERRTASSAPDAAPGSEGEGRPLSS